MGRAGSFQHRGQWIRTDLKLAILMRDHFTCLWCQVDLTLGSTSAVTLDHLVGLKEWKLMTLQERLAIRLEGSPNVSWNLITCCRRCNGLRSDTPWEQFGMPEARQRIEQQRWKLPNRELAKVLLGGTWGDEEVESSERGEGSNEGE